MNTEERDKRESQSQGPRPCRPFLPRLQPNSPGNQMNQADQWRSGTFYPIPVPVPIQWSHAHSVPGFADCGQSTVMDNRRMSSASVVAGTAGNSISICSDMSSNVTMSGPFTGLLALANANSLPQATARISGTNIWPELNRRESRTHGQIDITIKSAASKTSTQQINRDYRIPEFCYYDLNMPPPATQECNIHNSSQYAPFTPDKTVRAQQQRIDTDNILANLERNHETKAAESTGAVFKTTELELQVDNDLPSTAKSAPSKDTADEVDINKTPEKKPKRKKHRPKVINERKSRTQKQATPKPTASKDPTKPKRKYVRKKGLDKATPAKVSAASIDPSMMEGSNRSCKKALNFDNEAHPTEHGANLDSVSTAQPTRETEDMVAKKRSSIANNLLNQETEVPTSLPESLATPTEATCPPNILSANFSYIQKTGIVQCPATASHSSRTANNIIVEMGATSREIAAMRKFTSDDRNSNFTQHQVGSGMATLGEQNRVHLQRVRRTQEILAGSQPKRRKFGVEAQDNKFPSKEPKYCPQPTHANNAAPIRHNSCVEAISAETSTLTRKAQKKSIVNSSCLRTQQAHAQIFAHISGDSQKDICIEVLIKQLQNLYIDKEKQHGDQQENALVLFDPVKKTPRPKVEIDEETNRVWKLLLEDINSQGIDGTNEDNMKKWKEEREVFRGRANSFIARMRLVQGDRHFSPWKGSVVDSVVGVFLTQNVSDHLSSSAFMTLAARFPSKSEEGTSTLTDETDLSISDSEDILKKPTCEKRNVTVSSIATDEENKAVNSSESSRSITGTYCCAVERKAADDTASSQTSVDRSVTHTAEQIVLCSNNNSEPEDATRNLNSRELHSSTSFVDLLQMQRPLFQMQGFTMPYEVYSHESTNILPKVPYAGQNQCQGTVYDYHRHQTENFRLYKSIPGEKINPSTNYQLLPNTNTGLEFQYPHMTSQENRLSAAFKNKDKDLHCTNKERETIARAAAPSAAPCISKITDNEDSVFSGRLPDKGTTFWPESGHDSVSRVSPDFPSRKEDAGQQEFFSYGSCNMGDVTEITSTFEDPGSREQKTAECNANLHASTTTGEAKKSRSKQENNKTDAFDWDSLRRAVESNGKKKRTDNTMDSLDWEAVRCAEVHEIAETIKERGMNRILAERIKAFLNRLVDDHGSVDLEWLRDVQPDKAKEYLLSIRGLGLKSVECVRLLTLHHLAFPVDVNVGRIAVRLGWVPLQPLPEKLQIHLLDLYPVLESIQKYLWPRLCKLDQKTLYELHYQLITFGKVFCTKNRPNCNACPMRGECRHFASAFASARLPLPGPEQKSLVNVPENGTSHQNHAATNHMPLPIPLPLPSGSEQTRKFWLLEQISDPSSIEPIIEMPGTPEPEPEEGQSLEIDIEDTWNISKGIPHIDLDIEGLKQNLQEYVREHQGGEISKALVALTSEAASIPMPQLKYVNRLRTEHQVYELPDSHPLLSHMDKREPDDPCLYLLAIWRPGETADSTEPPEKTCNSQEPGNLCDDVKCFSCNSIREANSQVVRGTLLVPCRTAMKGSFPLNGTYFQVNEVFADHESSYNPIIVPRDWLWNLPRRTVYFGTSVPSIFKGLDCKKIQHCFWRGHVCIRGFEQKTRAPRPLSLRFHCSPGKLDKAKDKMDYAGKPPKKQPDL